MLPDCQASYDDMQGKPLSVIELLDRSLIVRKSYKRTWIIPIAQVTLLRRGSQQLLPYYICKIS